MESPKNQVSVFIDLTDDAIATKRVESHVGEQKQWIGADDLVGELHASVAPTRNSAGDGDVASRPKAASEKPPPSLGVLHPLRWWRELKYWALVFDRALVDGGGRAY